MTPLFQLRGFSSLLLILALFVSFATSARLLDETHPIPAVAPALVAGGTTPPPEVPAIPTAGAATPPVQVPALPTAPQGAAATAPAEVPALPTAPEADAAAAAPPVVPGEGDAAAATDPVVPGDAAPAAATDPVVPGDAATAPAAVVPPGGATAAPGGVPAGNPAVPAAAVGDDHVITFFMHDILGGSRPSAISVTGIVANPAGNGQVPFAKLNGAVLNVNSGVPSDNNNGGIINNNNIPFLSGLGGFTTNVHPTDGSGGTNIVGGMPGFPVLNADQFPTGTTLQKLMFGTMTVFNDELTEGHQVGSGLVGKAQGFYIASSEDGTSQTMAFTVMFKSGSYADSLSLFGVHRTAVAESHLAIMGGTGKFTNAKGFATVKTLPVGTNSQETDGMQTILEVIIYLAY